MRGSGHENDSDLTGTCPRPWTSVPERFSQSVPGFENVSGVSCTGHKAKVLVPSVTRMVWVSLRRLDSPPKCRTLRRSAGRRRDWCEFAENGVGRQRTVLPDFLGQFTRFAGQSFGRLRRASFFFASTFTSSAMRTVCSVRWRFSTWAIWRSVEIFCFSMRIVWLL